MYDVCMFWSENNHKKKTHLKKNNKQILQTKNECESEVIFMVDNTCNKECENVKLAVYTMITDVFTKQCNLFLFFLFFCVYLFIFCFLIL